jgi:hypothetical protein
MTHNLEVFNKNQLIFHSNRCWLHPLFDLEMYLQEHEYNPVELLVKDKIVGKAAALLMIYLNIGRIEAQLLSEIAKNTLEYFKIPFTYIKLVDRIKCKTEELLLNEFDVNKAYWLLWNKAYGNHPNSSVNTSVRK